MNDINVIGIKSILLTCIVKLLIFHNSEVSIPFFLQPTPKMNDNFCPQTDQLLVSAPILELM